MQVACRLPLSSASFQAATNAVHAPGNYQRSPATGCWLLVQRQAALVLKLPLVPYQLHQSYQMSHAKIPSQSCTTCNDKRQLPQQQCEMPHKAHDTCLSLSPAHSPGTKRMQLCLDCLWDYTRHPWPALLHLYDP